MLILLVILALIAAAFMLSGGPAAKQPPPSSKDVARLARSGHYAAAVKQYRRIYNVSRAEAKAAVEKMIEK